MLGFNLDDGRILKLGSKHLWVLVQSAPYLARKTMKPEVIAEAISSGSKYQDAIVENVISSFEYMENIGILIKRKTGYSIDQDLIIGKAPRKQKEPIDKSRNQKWGEACTSYVTINNHILDGDHLDRFKLFVKAFDEHGDIKGGAESWWKLEKEAPVDPETMKIILAAASAETTNRKQAARVDSTRTFIFMQGWISKRRWESFKMPFNASGATGETQRANNMIGIGRPTAG